MHETLLGCLINRCVHGENFTSSLILPVYFSNNAAHNASKKQRLKSFFE